LLTSPAALAQRRALIERDAGSLDSELVRHKWNLFLELMRWAEGGSCRHDAILRYFGDEEETLAGCGRCDNCLSLAAPDAQDEEATALAVRKALSAVARIHGRFGLGAAAKLLLGAADPRLERTGLVNTPTFGALRDKREEWLSALLRRCVTAGFVDLSGGERPVATLTPEGSAVMRAQKPARLLLPPEPGAARAGDEPRGVETPRAPKRSKTRSEPALGASELALFEALRQHRLEVSRAQGVPPYVVASDRTLREIAAARPASVAALAGVYGIGAAKAERFGGGLIEVVRRFAN
jgi:ATP-dependent DNA helicase RecQ